MNDSNHDSECPLPAEITLIHFWADFMYERSANSEPLNSEELVGKVLEQLDGRHLQIGQLIAPVRFRGKILQLVVKDIRVPEGSESGAGGDTSAEVGLLNARESAVLFSTIPGSLLRMTGSAVYSTDGSHAKSTLKSRFQSLLPRRFKS